MVLSPFLEALIYGVRDVFSGATQLARKSQLVFRNNLTATVVGEQIIVDATGGGGGGGGLPITSGAHTALDEGPGGGGTALFIGEDHNASAPSVYDAIEIAANTLIDVAIGGAASVFSFYADKLQINNGNAVSFSEDATTTGLPVIGKIKLKYNGGVARPIIAVKDSVGADRSFVIYGGSDAWFVGNTSQDLHLIGFLSATLDLSQDVTIGGRYAIMACPVIVEAGLTVNLLEKDADFQLTLQSHTVVAIPGATTVTLPVAGAMSDGATKEIVNATGGNLTVAVDGGGGEKIYKSTGLVNSEVLADGDSALYRYNSGAVSGTKTWLRVA